MVSAHHCGCKKNSVWKDRAILFNRGVTPQNKDPTSPTMIQYILFLRDLSSRSFSWLIYRKHVSYLFLLLYWGQIKLLSFLGTNILVSVYDKPFSHLIYLLYYIISDIPYCASTSVCWMYLLYTFIWVVWLLILFQRLYVMVLI